MKCSNCGYDNKSSDKFCKNCGNSLNNHNPSKSIGSGGLSVDPYMSSTLSTKKVLIIAVAIIICVSIIAGAFISMNNNPTNSNNLTSESSNNHYSFGDNDVRIISGSRGSIGNDNPDNSYQDECNVITSTGEDDDYCFGASNYVSTEIIKGGKNSVHEVCVYTSWLVFVNKVEVTVTDFNGQTHKITKDIDESMQQSFDVSVPNGCSIDQIHCYVHN